MYNKKAAQHPLSERSFNIGKISSVFLSTSRDVVLVSIKDYKVLVC